MDDSLTIYEISFRITERKAIVMCGLLPLLISNIIMLPYSGPTPLMQQSYHSITVLNFVVVPVLLRLNFFIDVSEDLSNLNETYLSDTMLTFDYNATQHLPLHNVSRHRGSYDYTIN